MSLLPARLQINDAPFKLGEKVQPKKAEPVQCPYAAFESGKHRPTDPEQRKLWKNEEYRQLYGAGKKISTDVKPGADPDDWIPHDGGPCPVEEDTAVHARFCDGTEDVGKAKDWYWGPLEGAQLIAYKLATSPEAPKPFPKYSEVGALYNQQMRQQHGLPVQWDKVPVGSKVWVRGGNHLGWHKREFEAVCPLGFMARIREGVGKCWWTQCKLHIEGVEP